MNSIIQVLLLIACIAAFASAFPQYDDQHFADTENEHGGEVDNRGWKTDLAIKAAKTAATIAAEQIIKQKWDETEGDGQQENDGYQQGNEEQNDGYQQFE
jgi:hypothetical protein